MDITIRSSWCFRAPSDKHGNVGKVDLPAFRHSYTATKIVILIEVDSNATRFTSSSPLIRAA